MAHLTSAEAADLLERFRPAMPAAAVRTTMIVGFPGETDAEFEALLDFVGAAGRRARATGRHQ